MMHGSPLLFRQHQYLGRWHRGTPNTVVRGRGPHMVEKGRTRNIIVAGRCEELVNVDFAKYFG